MKDHSETVVDALPQCDFCKLEGHEERASYDAKTTAGPWAYMCDRHFTTNAYGLGLGVGQRLVLRAAAAGEAVER